MIIFDFLEMDIGELSSRGWEESDNEEKWSKRAVVHIDPRQRQANNALYDSDDDDHLRLGQY